MHYAKIGRTDVHLSAVGFGTCQLRLVPESQALAALVRGFELGVNWVHTSADYGGAEELVARAIAISGRDVIPVTDGSGTMEHFEYLFENSCRIFGRRELPMWGISCIDDQEFVGHNVWGAGGMVESALRKKREGKIGALFCTTHGPPEYVANLITSGVFDAVMLAYNPLGFHVLSYYAKAEGKIYEDLPANRARIFGLAQEHQVSVLVMKALGGGLLGKSKAFAPHHVLADERDAITATDVLRYILSQDGVTCVVPGTASVEEAEENALAGSAPIALAPERALALEQRVASMRTKLCSRCGECEPTCSKGLPISWMFRDAYMWMNPSDTFDAVGRLHYFHLHPEQELACATCDNKTCICPQGLDIPFELARVHEGMTDLRTRGLLPRTPAELDNSVVGAEPAVRVVYAELPKRLVPTARGLCRLWIENAGKRRWASALEDAEYVALDVTCNGRFVERVPLRHDVHPGFRAHVAFDLRSAPSGQGDYRFALTSVRDGNSTEIASATIGAEASQ